MESSEWLIQRVVELLGVYAQAFLRPDLSKEARKIFQGEAGELARHVDICAELFWKKYGVYFPIKQPGHGYLSDDCFTPYGFEESDSVVTSSLSGVFSHVLSLYQLSAAPITIPFRGEGSGKGAVFDHRTFQQITGRKTLISMPGMISRDIMATTLDKYHDDILVGRDTTPEGRSMPEVVTDDLNHAGLLVLTGRARYTETRRPVEFHARMQHEYTLVQIGCIAGRPIFAVCGGLWALVDALGGRVAGLPKKVQEDHTGAMPGLSREGLVTSDRGRIIGSEMKHDIVVSSTTLMCALIAAKSLKRALVFMAVNSVHWAHVVKVPKGFRVAAYTAVRPGPFSAHGPQILSPIEAIESDRQVGTQSHFEAVAEGQEDSEKHHALINNMAAMGQGFFHHRQRLRDLRAQQSSEAFHQEVGSPTAATRSIEDARQLESTTDITTPASTRFTAGG